MFGRIQREPLKFAWTKPVTFKSIKINATILPGDDSVCILNLFYRHNFIYKAQVCLTGECAHFNLYGEQNKTTTTTKSFFSITISIHAWCYRLKRVTINERGNTDIIE